MATDSLNILVCGNDELAVRRITRSLRGAGITVLGTTNLIEDLCFSRRSWDILLIDLEGLNSYLRSMLPILCRDPGLTVIGISAKTDSDLTALGRLGRGYVLELDGCLSETPRPEDFWAFSDLREGQRKYLSPSL